MVVLSLLSGLGPLGRLVLVNHKHSEARGEKPEKSDALGRCLIPETGARPVSIHHMNKRNALPDCPVSEKQSVVVPRGFKIRSDTEINISSEVVLEESHKLPCKLRRKFIRKNIANSTF